MANNIYLPPSPVVPGFLLISAITQTFPMVITVINSIYNTYIVGQLVTLTIPSSYGMIQANEKTGKIVGINSTDFSVDIDARSFDDFVLPNPLSLPPPSRPASLSPGGARNIYNSTVVPFHSLNGNTGN